MKKIILSAALVEEIFQHLIKEPYANVAALIAKLQTEAAPQFAAPDEPPTSVDDGPVNGGAA